MKLDEIKQNYHPQKHILYFLLFVLLAVIVSIRFDLRNPEFERAMKDGYFRLENFEQIVIIGPIKEELAVRGPSWIILVAAMLIGQCFPRTYGFFNKLLLRRLTALHIFFWFPLLLLNFCWSLDHIWPLLAFAMGIIFGCIIFYTREIFYGIPGILLAILFHIIFNFFTFCGTIARIHLLQ